MLETLKAAGLLDSQRAGGRRRAPEVEESGPSDDEVQWRVEAPQRLREGGDVDMFDSPAMVKPSEPDEDLPPVGLGAAFIKGPVIPTARVPEPLPEPEVGTSDSFLGFGDVEPDEPTPIEPTPTQPAPTEPTPTEPTPTQPTPTEQMPIEATPTEPVQSAPVESVPAETPVAETPVVPEPVVGEEPEPAAQAEPVSTPEPQAVEEPPAEGQDGEPFVRTVVVGGRTIDLTDGSPSATRASRRPKSDLSLAELLAEALVAYEAGRREDEAAQAQHQHGHEDSAESTVPIPPVAPPVTDSETTAPIERVTAEPPRWTLPES